MYNKLRRQNCVRDVYYEFMEGCSFMNHVDTNTIIKLQVYRYLSWDQSNVFKSMIFSNVTDFTF